MTSVIGVDFDNTIACYDHVFSEVAHRLGLLKSTSRLTKSEVKKVLLSRPDGEMQWQRLQGKVYGKYMSRAELFPGFMEFLAMAKIQGHKVYIVSHKTEHGHFDEEGISLRDAALKWLEVNKIYTESHHAEQVDAVYFEATRADKISRVKQLECDVVIDDLTEVFEEGNFDNDVSCLLFDPHNINASNQSYKRFFSWRQICDSVLGPWTENLILKAFKYAFPDIMSTKASLEQGRGNSQIFKIVEATGESYALKIYPDLQLDNRPRLKTEFSATRLLTNIEPYTLTGVDKNEALGWALYHWIDGQPITVIDDDFIENAIEFIKSLKYLSDKNNLHGEIYDASEACLSGSEIERQINSRLKRLLSIQSLSLHDFLMDDFHPVFESKVCEARKAVIDFDKEIGSDLRILSPSDFGAHNTITDGNNITFIDFEYFGWDDPVKLVSDFIWHPGMQLSQENKMTWITSMQDLFNNDTGFKTRLAAYLPLYALRWCLILLNEFLPGKIEQRLKSSNRNYLNVELMQTRQLEKAKYILKQLHEEKLNYGSALQAS